MTLLCKLDRLAAEEQVSSLDEARLKRELKARLADILDCSSACRVGPAAVEDAGRESIAL